MAHPMRSGVPCGLRDGHKGSCRSVGACDLRRAIQRAYWASHREKKRVYDAARPASARRLYMKAMRRFEKNYPDIARILNDAA